MAKERVEGDFKGQCVRTVSAVLKACCRPTRPWWVILPIWCGREAELSVQLDGSAATSAVIQDMFSDAVEAFVKVSFNHDP